MVLNIETESIAKWRTCQAIGTDSYIHRILHKPLQLVFCLFNLENKIIVKAMIFTGELPRYKHTVGILNEYDIYQLFLIIRKNWK